MVVIVDAVEWNVFSACYAKSQKGLLEIVSYKDN